MLYDNPLLTKDSMTDAYKQLSSASRILIWDSNDLPEQVNAGWQLRRIIWPLACIMDHIFDYYPYTAFISEEDKKNGAFVSYMKEFMSNPNNEMQKAIQYAENNFAVLDTVHWTNKIFNIKGPKRNLEKEVHTVSVLKAIQDNLDEIITLLNGPKKVNDPTKPTYDEIKSLIQTIQYIQQNLMSGRPDESSIQMSQMVGMYLNPLLLAWQVYQYGWHSDFRKGGFDQFSFQSFQVRARKVITDLIKTLEGGMHPFIIFDGDSSITNGLLKVYKHLLTQDFESKM